MSNIFVILLMFFLLNSCENNSKTNSNTDSNTSYNKNKTNQREQSNSYETYDRKTNQRTQSNSYETPKKKETTYYHSCESGCVVINQDGTSRFKYKKKCNYCGKTSNITSNRTSTSGTMTSSHYCNTCKKKSNVRLKSSRN